MLVYKSYVSLDDQMSELRLQSTNIKPEKAKADKKRGPKKRKKITPTYLHNAGLYYLQRYAASSSHFRQVMLRKVKKSCAHHPEQDYDTCAAMVEDIIEKFVETGLINDDLYTRGVVNTLRRQGKSTRAVHAKLRSKGVPADLIDSHLREYSQEHHDDAAQAELHAALILARRKKLGPFRKNNDSDRKKELAALARAGYPYDIAKKVIDYTQEDAEDILRRF